MPKLRTLASAGKARWAVILLLLTLAALPALAQTGTGGLTILVLDENDEPLPAATVVLSSTQKKVATTAELSNKKGQVKFPVLAAGSGYVIEVSFPTYGTQKRDLSVRIGEDQLITVKLVEELTEEVKVVAQAQVVELEKTSTSTKFSDDFIADLPVAGRSYTNVLTLAPGVQDADKDGNPNVHGSRARDFKALVSGVSNVDPLTGQVAGEVNMDSIEEIEVITAGAGPAFGRAQGGFANIIQKQGSNEREGVFTFLFQSSVFDGDGAGNTPRLRKPEFQTLRPSVQFTGPIIKDKLWYALSHDYIDRETPINVTNGVEVTTTQQLISSDRFTWQISPRNKLTLQYQGAPYDVDNFGVSSLTPPEAAALLGFDSETYSVTWEAPYSPQIYVKSLVAWQEFGYSLEPTTAGINNNCVSGPSFVQQAQCFNGRTGEVSGSYPFFYDDDRQRLTVKTDGTLYPRKEWLGMSHQFDVGFIVENERYELSERILPQIGFFELQQTNDDDQAFDKIGLAVATFNVPEARTDSAAGATWGFYFLDKMKPRSNIQMELGARIEREIISSEGLSDFDPRAEFKAYNDLLAQGVSERTARVQTFTSYESVEPFKQQLASVLGIPVQNLTSFFGPITNQAAFQQNVRRPVDIHLTNTNVAPFFSFSWDPWSNGKTKVAFSAGRKYNNIPLTVPAEELTTTRTSVAFIAKREEGVWVVPDLLSTRGSINPAAGIRLVDRELKTPYQDELSVTFERELWTETSFSVNYVNRKYRDQLQDQDLNHTVGDFGTCLPVSVPGGSPIDTTQPDGIIDDCTGEYFLPPGSQQGTTDPFNPNNRIERPDGFADLYTLNPFWGPVLLIGNSNKIDYDGVTLKLSRRQYRGWQMEGSYTWSQAKGDGEDYDQDIGNDPAVIDDEAGFQSYDQRHVIKWQATKQTPWGIRLGSTVTWESGLPFSLLRRRFSIDTLSPTLGNFGSNEPRLRVQYPTGQRNDQRNISTWTIDLKATREFTVGARMNMQLALEIFNVLNEGTYKVYNIFREEGRQINGINEAYREFGRRFQLSARVSF